MSVLFLHAQHDPLMTKPQRRKASRKKTQPLLYNGLWATFAGSILWLLSMIMARHEPLEFAARALLAPAAMGIFVGLGLMLMHVLSKRRAMAEAKVLLRQHSTLLEPMPKLRARPKTRFTSGQQRSSAAGR
ncbi:MAG: hypothetical protein Q8Q82_06985 [Hydrogenophaga sp.]|jgi:hypothetical protein|nr:hypothetical protein [Hydrogenophaga sp.]